jgi:molybdenum cofactor cytidylyltransferase
MNKNPGLYLLLAAGFSRRFGSPKQLHPLPTGNSIISSSIKTLQASACNFLVVIREDDTAISTHLETLNIETIKVKNAQYGLSSVIAEATRKLNLVDIKWLGICLGDMPYIKPSTLSDLAAHASTTNIVRPRYLAQQGHPVLFGSEYFSELKNLEGDLGAKAIIKAHPRALHIVDVIDAMVLHDIDQAKDIISTS